MQGQELTVQELLQGLDQKHILQAYRQAPQKLQKQLHQQLIFLNSSCFGGLKNYYNHAKQLLKNASDSINPYHDYQVSVPNGVNLHFRKENLEQIAYYEKIGMEEIEKTAFVLVAGGLGERLGYPGIKISIPFELLTGKSFIQYYIQYILAFQAKFCSQNTRIPLLIMTSEDTHEKTLAFLQKNSYFGMQDQQIIIVQQQKVPALINNQAHFSLINREDKLLIQTKPHGHGDIHALIYSHRVAKKWFQEGKKWIIFFQDTNPLAFRSYLSVLGVSSDLKYEYNSITMKRKPGEAVGVIANLFHKETKKHLIVNIEYNQIANLLQSHGGEEKDEEGYSIYPGNINSFVIDAARYHETLEKTKGIIAEFINPKYTDKTKSEFKSSARLERMMQDYPLLLQNCQRVGHTSIEREFCFSALKNSRQIANSKFKQGLPCQSAATCEADFYQSNRAMLKLCGAQIQEGDKCQIDGVGISMYPMISISPFFATCITEMRQKVKKVKISKKSSLVLTFSCIIQDLVIDSHCQMGSCQKPLILENYKIVTISSESRSPSLDIRGYSIE